MNQRTEINPKVVILVLGTLNGLMPFSTDLYLPAFSQIAQELHTNIGNVTLTMSSFFVGSCIGQLCNGPFLDRFGRKNPMLVGLVIFFITSLACAYATDIQWFIFFRFLQALGISICSVGSRSIVRDLFPAEKIASIFSTLSLVMGIAPIIAPSVGSLVLSLVDWRTIFQLLALMSFSLFLILYFFLPSSGKPTEQYSLHPKAILTNYKEVLKTPTFLGYALVTALASGSLFTWISSSSLVFIQNFGLSPKQFGWVFASTASCLVLGNQVNRILLKRFWSEQLALRAAISQLIVSTCLLMIVVFFFKIPIMLGGLYAFMLSLSLITPNAMALSIRPFTKNIGSANALMGAMQMTLSAVVTGIVSLLYDGTAKPMAYMMILLTCCSVLIQFFLKSKRAERP